MEANEIILQLYARTPAPYRDYCGLTITHTEVILNIWRVTFGPHVYPTRLKCFIDDFLGYKLLQVEIIRCFGETVFDYLLGIAKKEINLQSFPTKVFLNIIKFLAVRDLRSISQASKILFNVMYKLTHIRRINYFKRNPERNDTLTAQRCGWKETLRQKIKKLKSIKKVPVKSSPGLIVARKKEENLNNNSHLASLKSPNLKSKINNLTRDSKFQVTPIQSELLNTTKVNNILMDLKTEVITVKRFDVIKKGSVSNMKDNHHCQSSMSSTTSNSINNQVKSVKSVELNRAKVVTNLSNTTLLTKSPTIIHRKKPINSKLDATRSMSVLEPGKSRSVGINPVASTISLKNSVKKTLPQAKSEIKLNNVHQVVRKTDVKIEVPIELKRLIASNQSSSMVSKLKNINAVKK